MLSTPDTSHLGDLPVYPPSEDSYLLLDVLVSQHAYLSTRFSANSSRASPAAPVVCEIGTGSGVVIAFVTAQAARIFGRTDIGTLAVDLNPHACRAAGQTVSGARAANNHNSNIAVPPADSSGASSNRNLQSSLARGQCVGGTWLDAVQADLTAGIRRHSIDVLLFNPPYVPTDGVPVVPSQQHQPGPLEQDWEERESPAAAAATTTTTSRLSAFALESRFLDLAVAGGRDGMEVTWRLLDALDEVLTGDGVAYLLLCARNRPEEVMAVLRGRGWCVDKVGDSGRKGGFEKLCIVRIARVLK